MQITCSNCNSNYSLSTEQINRIKDSIFICKKCKKSIKITFCPHCGSFYSITFSGTHNKRYRFSCKKCKKSFIVEFPVIYDARETEGPSSRRILPEKSREAKIDSKNRIVIRSREAERKPSGTAIVFKGTTFKEFNIKELLTICSGAFSKPKLIISASGLTILILIMLLYSKIEDIFFTPLFIRDSQYIKLFLNLFPILLFFFGIILILALISRITLENIFLNIKWNFEKTVKFTLKILIPVLISNIFILFLGNLVLILFGKIPLIGPVFYSLLFLPIYLISFLIIITLIIGFWFYPPILAYKEVGILKNISHLFHFIKRHNLKLILVIPILIISSSILFTVIYLFHIGAFSITISLSKFLLQENITRLFSAIPFNLLRISDFSFVGTDIVIYKSLMTDLLLSHQIGGVIIGTVLTVISIMLFASYISIIGTISSHVYIVMERDIDIDDRKKIKLLLVLVLFLLGIFLFKKIYM